MHFSLPKPLHGWREFVGEVGIIVLGVLIALSAEQMAEWLHWRHEVQAARDALNEEAVDNLNAANFRASQQACVDRRLNEIALIFDDHARGRRLNIYGSIGHPVYEGGEQDVWQVEVGGQALSHMSSDEKLGYSAAFSAYANLNQVLLREQDAWLRLGILDRPEVLQEGDWPMLHQALAEANSLNRRMQVITSEVLSKVSLGQRPRAVPLPPGIQLALKTICTPVRK